MFSANQTISRSGLKNLVLAGNERKGERGRTRPGTGSNEVGNGVRQGGTGSDEARNGSNKGGQMGGSDGLWWGG